MKNKQGFSTLVLIIILAALALGGEYAAWKNRSSTPIGGSPTSPDVDSFTTAPAPTTDLDTTGWKTYRDDSFGFEVEYPSDWDSTTYPPSNENYTTYLHDANYTG
ncbi:MAG: hypothetical protein HYT47_01860, partial [Candidatus Vogelbacteria bacterium]|nr:hypothetical protein [Candidatus Vogelbacteria bacterium]